MKSNNCVNQFGQVGKKASKNDDFLTEYVIQFGQVGPKNRKMMTFKQNV